MCITLRFRATRCVSNQRRAIGRKRILFHGNRRLKAGVEHARLRPSGIFSNARIVSKDAGTHSSPLRRCVKTQKKCRQNAGTVPATRNAGMQGRPVAGFSRSIRSVSLLRVTNMYHFCIIAVKLFNQSCLGLRLGKEQVWEHYAVSWPLHQQETA